MPQARSVGVLALDELLKADCADGVEIIRQARVVPIGTDALVTASAPGPRGTTTMDVSVRKALQAKRSVSAATSSNLFLISGRAALPSR